MTNEKKISTCRYSFLFVLEIPVDICLIVPRLIELMPTTKNFSARYQPSRI